MVKPSGKPVRQEALWVATHELPRAGAHPFQDRVNQILNDNDSDNFFEDLCRKFYAEKVGRP